MSEENAEVTVETTKTAEELQESLRKAEAKIVELKKATATPKEDPKEEGKTETTGFDENTYKKLREEEKFFESNPDMVEYKDKLQEKIAKGYSWKDAKLSVENDDETIANRKAASQMNFTKTDSWAEKMTYTLAQLEALPQWEYEKVMDLKSQGKVTFTK